LVKKKNIKRILVTGADGFIGSHLVERLVRDGFNVRAFVFYNSFNSWGWLDNLPNQIKDEIEIFAGDIRDPFGVKEAMKGCDVVYHLAALIAIPFSYHSPSSYVETNISGTLNILQSARELNIDKIIHTSTSEVYGSANYVPIDENHPLQGQSPYSATKISADQLAFSFFSSFSLPVVTLRPFNTYGPRQSARAVIPTIISQLAQGSKKIRLGSIHPTRDFNYITDTVSGFVSVLNCENVYGETINLGSNFEVSIGDTVKTIAKIMDVDYSIITDDKRIRPKKSEVERLWADNKKAKELLGWQPEFSGMHGFEKGLSHTVEWFLDEKNLKSYKSHLYNI